MPTRERTIDRARRSAAGALARLGSEIRHARLDRGLTVDVAARGAGISNAEWSRIERALAPRVPLVVLGQCAAVVGLELVPRLYPGGPPVRDAAHLRLLAALRGHLAPTLTWATEVPLPLPGDPRAWDATIGGPGWRYGVECETAPRDAQALVRRLALKERDGAVDGVLLVLPETRRVAEFLRLATVDLESLTRVAGPAALTRLAAGDDPGGSAVIRLPGAFSRQRGGSRG